MRDLANRRRALDAQIAVLNAEAEECAGDIRFAIEREKFAAESVAARAREIAGDGGSQKAARAGTKNGRKPARATR
jgi:circadian clock protein KaiC